MNELTKEQAAILGAYTGILCGPFEEMHQYIEKILGRPVFTHELADLELCAEIKAKSRSDFLEIVRGA